MEETTIQQKIVRHIEQLSKGELSEVHGLQTITLTGIHIVEVRPGFVRCSYTIPSTVTDKDGNWHAGAVATLTDMVAATAAFSLASHPHVSVELSVSFYSMAKIQEEVEIEAKIVGYRGKLQCVEVEMRRKDNGELIALGSQWMSSIKIPSQLLSKL